MKNIAKKVRVFFDTKAIEAVMQKLILPGIISLLSILIARLSPENVFNITLAVLAITCSIMLILETEKQERYLQYLGFLAASWYFVVENNLSNSEEIVGIFNAFYISWLVVGYIVPFVKELVKE